jgi:uncharacterized membrane protein
MATIVARYHLHPITDHFTIALLSIGVLADVAGWGIAASLGNRWPSISIFAARLRAAVPVLLIPGAVFAVCSRLSGEIEADRVWDALSPAAQQILFSDTGPAPFLSHAVLGSYLMYSFGALAVWRILLEVWTTVRRSQVAYFAAALIALCALLYQGNTGGELVYDHAAGTSHLDTTLPQPADAGK